MTNSLLKFIIPRVEIRNQVIQALFVVVLLSLIISAPLLRPGMFSGHDNTIRDHLRLHQFEKGLKAGHCLPRWAPDFYFGYGYPFFNFYQPLIYYVAAMFKLTGVSYTIALKLLLFTGIVLSGCAMYFCSRRAWGHGGGLVSAVIYLFAPYHLADLYVRSSMAEFFSFVFFPVIFLQLMRIFAGQSAGLPAAFAVAGLTLCHNIEALFFLPFIAIIGSVEFFRTRNRGSFLVLLRSMAGGVGLAAFFWLPAMWEKQYVHIDRMTEAGYNLFIHFLFPFQLIQSVWGHDASGPGVERFPVFLESMAVILLAGAFLWSRPKDHPGRPWMQYAAGMLLVALFMTTELSSGIWTHIPLIRMAQFPWRLLAPASFCFAFLGGMIAVSAKSEVKLISVIVIILIVASAGKYCRGINYYSVPDSFFSVESIRSRGATTTASNEYLPRYGTEFDRNHGLPRTWRSRVEIVSGSGTVANIEEHSSCFRAEITADSGVNLRVNALYFPGWRAALNGRNIPLAVLPNGLMTISGIQPGKHTLKVWFGSTPVRIFGTVISGGSFLMLLGIILRQRGGSGVP